MSIVLPDPATYGGPVARYWDVPVVDRPDTIVQTNLGMWLLHCPTIRKSRQYWILTLVTLANFPGVKPAQIYAPGAMHEFGLFSVPTEDGLSFTPEGITIDYDDQKFGFQCALTSDHAARLVGARVAKALADGEMYLEPSVIGNATAYHAEALVAIVEDCDAGWHIARGPRPKASLSQYERPPDRVKYTLRRGPGYPIGSN